MLYFEQGIPKNHSHIEATFLISPKLVSVTPVSGSVGGTLITLIVPGATISDTIDILDSTGVSICESTTVTAYGVVQCKTLAQEIASTELSITKDGEVSPCVSTDKSVCTYEQLASSAFPAVQSVSKTDSTIVFTGTNFDIADFTHSAFYFNVEATSVVVDSATQATATFDLGVPVANGEVFPFLVFSKDDVKHYGPSAVALVNDLDVTASMSGLQCSFAGECTYDVTANGLASIMRQNPDENYISVCSEKCVFDEDASTATVTKCKVPKISTIYSNENFEIAKESENLKGTTFGTGDYELAFDDKLIEGPSVLSGNCRLGMEFKEGHVGYLS